MSNGHPLIHKPLALVYECFKRAASAGFDALEDATDWGVKEIVDKQIQSDPSFLSQVDRMWSFLCFSFTRGFADFRFPLLMSSTQLGWQCPREL